MPTIRRIFLFGDSLSDCGTGKDSMVVGAAAAFGQAHINRGGRFSSGFNWVDHLFDPQVWSQGIECLFGGRLRCVTRFSNDVFSYCRDLKDEPELRYSQDDCCLIANYACGGATACGTIIDRNIADLAVSAVLDSFEEQIDKCLFHLAGKSFEDSDVAVIFFGGNDIYTLRLHFASFDAILHGLHVGIGRLYARGLTRLVILTPPEPQWVPRMVFLGRTTMSTVGSKETLITGGLPRRMRTLLESFQTVNSDPRRTSVIIDINSLLPQFIAPRGSFGETGAPQCVARHLRVVDDRRGRSCAVELCTGRWNGGAGGGYGGVDCPVVYATPGFTDNVHPSSLIYRELARAVSIGVSAVATNVPLTEYYPWLTITPTRALERKRINLISYLKSNAHETRAFYADMGHADVARAMVLAPPRPRIADLEMEEWEVQQLVSAKRSYRRIRQQIVPPLCKIMHNGFLR